MKEREIKTQPNKHFCSQSDFNIGGWLQGHQTYLWFGLGTNCIGTLEGHKLYRLAKAIVKQFEARP